MYRCFKSVLIERGVKEAGNTLEKLNKNLYEDIILEKMEMEIIS